MSYNIKYLIRPIDSEIEGEINRMNMLEFTAVLFSGLIAAYVIILILYHVQRQQDIHRCQEIIKKNSLTFYQAFSRINNKKKREAVYAVYAFCRYADNLADEDHNRDALEELEEELTLYKEGVNIHHFRWRALRTTTKPFYQASYDYKPFYDMIEGQKRDLNHQGFETLDELLTYCYLVAGTVGLMLIPILANEHIEELEKFAIELGYAMQITNILRDIGEDYQNHRIYIPREMMKNANYSFDDLAHGRINYEFRALFEELATLAEGYFSTSLDSIYLFPEDSRTPLALSIILYKEILNSCRENGYDVFSKKHTVSEEKKNLLIQDYLDSI
ncbi:MAG: phytoene/squalene synthase family protein [Acholeplasmataceae bacterium]|nr:phytoene/squalene synthase family protein [Acholeplasmataceae bacterium]